MLIYMLFCEFFVTGGAVGKLLKLNELSKLEVQSLLPSDDVANRLALYFQNFSDQTRIKILTCLSVMDMCVSDLSAILNVNQTTLSHQLKTLKDQNIVSYRREGKVIVYMMKAPSVQEMMMCAVDSLGRDQSEGF